MEGRGVGSRVGRGLGARRNMLTSERATGGDGERAAQEDRPGALCPEMKTVGGTEWNPGKPWSCDLGGRKVVPMATRGGPGTEVQRVFLQSPPPTPTPGPGEQRELPALGKWVCSKMN